MTPARSSRLRGFAQVAVAIGYVLLCGLVWPSHRSPVDPSTPFYIAVFAFAIYLVWPDPKKHIVPILGVGVANIIFFIGYAWLMLALIQWESDRAWGWIAECRARNALSCPISPPIFDPPAPPQHWELAVAGYLGLLFFLYAWIAWRGTQSTD